MKLNIDNLKCRSRKGVFTFEYVALIVLFALALLAMRFYLKGAMSGKLRGAADAFGQGKQYEPGVTVEIRN